jgi:hypothetical protein
MLRSPERTVGVFLLTTLENALKLPRAFGDDAKILGRTYERVRVCFTFLHAFLHSAQRNGLGLEILHNTERLCMPSFKH